MPAGRLAAAPAAATGPSAPEAGLRARCGRCSHDPDFEQACWAAQTPRFSGEPRQCVGELLYLRHMRDLLYHRRSLLTKGKCRHARLCSLTCM